MHVILLGEHSPESCPTSNAKIRKLLQETVSEIPRAAEHSGVKIVAGPYVNREHVTVVVLEADNLESVDAFVVASRLGQWHTIRVLPSRPIEEALPAMDALPAIF